MMFHNTGMRPGTPVWSETLAGWNVRRHSTLRDEQSGHSVCEPAV